MITKIVRPKIGKAEQGSNEPHLGIGTIVNGDLSRIRADPSTDPVNKSPCEPGDPPTDPLAPLYRAGL